LTEPGRGAPSPAEAAEHLAQIRQVIARSRAERARSGDIYLFWAIVIVAADASTLAGDLYGFPGWLAYPLGVPIGVVYAALSSIRRQRTWSSFGSRVEGRLWAMTTAAMVALSIGGFGTGLLNPRAIVPLVCAVVGIAIGTSGALFDSRARTLAGGMFVTVAAVGWFVSPVTQHLLFIAAMIAGYVVPALAMLRDEARRDA
jgi:hypothetical protein